MKPREVDANTTEFRSKLEDLMPAEELVFQASPGFGPYKSIMPPEAVAHPAKFNVHLVEFLIDKYTKPGDTVLDPMAGTGILGVIAALRGRNAIQVEIEPRFYEWMEKARQNVEKTPTLGRKGWIVNILGDARRLSELLNQVDAIMTSPPYADSLTHEHDELRETRLVLRKSGKNRGKPIALGRSQVHTIYSTSNNNIGNLPLGDIDAIITSPPYAETISHKSGGPTEVKKVGISTITARTYSTSNDNIGNLPLGCVDAIITSPPYESSLEGTSRHTRGGIASRDPKLAQSGTYSIVLSAKPGVTVTCSSNPSNIGNLKSRDEEYELVEHTRDLESLYRMLLKDGKPTYLSEMLKVYSEMYKVLKPGGHCIVVIKPFIRNKKVIDLPYYTWLLMERVGFKLVKLYKFRLPTKSFWRILYYKKHPEVPRIAHEYVIVTVKP
jgi:DNA modification methylase